MFAFQVDGGSEERWVADDDDDNERIKYTDIQHRLGARSEFLEGQRKKK